MASNKSGVFTLGDVGERQETGSWSTASDVWYVNKSVIVASNPFAYIIAGAPPYNPKRTDIDRIDYNKNIIFLTVWVNYLVNWVWIGTAIMLLGGLISLGVLGKRKRVRNN